MPTFRKRPVVVEARRVPLDKKSGDDLEEWGRLGVWLGHGGPWRLVNNGQLGVEIDTLEGRMLAKPGDYIIRGVAGELYPCRADIFHQTYERVGK